MARRFNHSKSIIYKCKSWPSFISFYLFNCLEVYLFNNLPVRGQATQMENHNHNELVSQNQFNIFLLSKLICLKIATFPQLTTRLRGSHSRTVFKFFQVTNSDLVSMGPIPWWNICLYIVLRTILKRIIISDSETWKSFMWWMRNSKTFV